MALFISSAIARQLAIKLYATFDSGAADASKQMSPVLDAAYMSPADTTANVYLTASSDYALRTRGLTSASIKFDGVRVYESRIEFPQFYKFIEVSLQDWKDDKIGKYAAVFHTLGMAMALGPSRLMEETFAASATAQNTSGNFDGVALHSTSHPVIPGDTSVLFSNLMTNPNGLDYTNFDAAWKRFRLQPNEDGRPCSRTPTTLYHKVADRAIAQDICFSDRPFGFTNGGGQGGGNPYRNLVIPKEVPYFDSVTNFGFELCDESIEMRKPYVFAEREAIQLVSLYTNPEGAWEKINNAMLFGVMGRMGAGYGDPRATVRLRTAA